ncbi:MAG: deoxyribodipyrimidine photo-lyase, partial [Chloroflexi bacterium]
PSPVGRFHSLDTFETPPLPSLCELGFVEMPISLPVATEAAAQQRLADFVDKAIFTYNDTRDLLAVAPPQYTSCLSPYLRFGLLSIRAIYGAARAAYLQAEDDRARKSVERWVSELAWREFYAHILWHYPHVLRQNFRREYDMLEWRDNTAALQAWQNGKTGYPIVDAAMRQLVQTGWLPNRARMIVASFLTKDLLIHWQEGERFFMQHLIDGDPASNNGGWQWTAGTGTDAQPYFRIFNPVKQSQKFDPDGVYIKRWIPELRDVPVPYIHQPWTMEHPPANYPAPIIDHAFARQRTLVAYGAARIAPTKEAETR